MKGGVSARKINSTFLIVSTVHAMMTMSMSMASGWGFLLLTRLSLGKAAVCGWKANLVRAVRSIFRCHVSRGGSGEAVGGGGWDAPRGGGCAGLRGEGTPPT